MTIIIPIALVILVICIAIIAIIKEVKEAQKEQEIKKECKNIFKAPLNNLEKILLAVISILLTLVIVVSSTLIYRKSYGTKIESNDIKFSYTIYDDEISVIVIPLTDIKNFQYGVIFSYGDNSYSEVMPPIKHQEAEKIINVFSKKEISKELDNYAPSNIKLKIISGYKNNIVEESTYILPSYNQCDFFISYHENRNISKPFTITITNNSKKSIVSIQNLSAKLYFDKNVSCEIYRKRLDLKQPLKPGESILIQLSDISRNFYYPPSLTGDALAIYNNQRQEAKKITNLSYDLVNGTKVTDFTDEEGTTSQIPVQVTK